MSCCGNKREEFLQLNSSANKNTYIPTKIFDDVWFEYTGETALTIKGNISRNVYRFSSKGDTQLIDYRDASSMMAINMLKRKGSAAK